MENTGRITRGLTPTARRLLFGATADEGIDTELLPSTQVDRAHLLMLAERGLVSSERVAALLKEIQALRACGFAPLRGRSALRGLYLLYEDHLIQAVGSEAGGMLQTGRSRNDLNATVLRLRLRAPYLRLLSEALRLQGILLRRAERFATVVMPVYTHYQAALPMTFGHYLAALALALGRDVEGLLAARADLLRCPLGAGAAGGTTLPIDTARTARLLGFLEPAPNSVDAVASRDLILRLLAASAVMGVTLSRLATDLLLWTTGEFGFLSLPDELVGSSSMMPQKRNPFLLEHVQGRSMAPLGAFVAAASAMHGTPYTNCIAVGTEGTGHVWPALQAVTEAVVLGRLVVAGVRPEPEAMRARAEAGYTTATELANRLTLQGQLPFRSAHHAVGGVIRQALEQGEGSLQRAASQWLVHEHPPALLEGLDAASVAHASEYGGGPGSSSRDACLEGLRTQWQAHRGMSRVLALQWREAERRLDTAERDLLAAMQERRQQGGASPT